MEQTTVTQESKGFYKLNWLQRIGFGSGDLAQNLIYQTICMYLLFFYTDIYGLNPGAVRARPKTRGRCGRTSSRHAHRADRSCGGFRDARSRSCRENHNFHHSNNARRGSRSKTGCVRQRRA